jgi:hypothetical protein
MSRFGSIARTVSTHCSMPKLGRKRTPSDVVNHEIVQGFEKSPIFLSLVALRERDAWNTCNTIFQSCSVIVVRWSVLQKPTCHESLKC